MPPKKRPYVPKTKGCYECSQRRIHCDRGEPECRKCISKGLKCSGLGIRHRFNNGVASRGKWAGKAMESIYKDEGWILNAKNPSRARGANRTTFIQVNPTPITVVEIGDEASSVSSDESVQKQISSISSPGGLGLDMTENFWSFHDEPIFDVIDDVSEVLPSDSSSDLMTFINLTPDMMPLLQPFPDHVPRWKRNMLEHFSKRIAREMVAIDGPHNGWRNLLLPYCEMDELVMNAVVTVASFHQNLSGSPTEARLRDLLKDGQYDFGSSSSSLQFLDPNRLYSTVIRGLQQRQELSNCDQASKHSILMTILVLLTGAMVTGGSDFPLLFRMLESAVNAIGGEQGVGAGEVAEFMMPQIHKMRVYAAPLLSEESGAEILSSESHASQLLECLRNWSRPYPEHSVAMSFIYDLVRQARDIYLGQVALRSTTCPTAADIEASVLRVQKFKETLEAFPHDSQGEQVLVWASFVAASDCTLEEHKAFFERVFLKHHERSGFSNLLIGLEYLRKIWARSPGERWTTILPQAQVLMM